MYGGVTVRPVLKWDRLFFAHHGKLSRQTLNGTLPAQFLKDDSVLSGCYHVCKINNRLQTQNDTSFKNSFTYEFETKVKFINKSFRQFRGQNFSMESSNRLMKITKNAEKSCEFIKKYQWWGGDERPWSPTPILPRLPRD